MKRTDLVTPNEDICLILEGTYPYVKGGVSTWVHDIVSNLEEFSFHLFFVGAKRSLATEYRYPIPLNVRKVTEIFLFDPLSADHMRPGVLPLAVRKEFHEKLRNFLLSKGEKEILQKFYQLTDFMAKKPVTLGNLFQDHEAWETLTEVYHAQFSNLSFIDFFWATRFMLLPLWQAWSQIPQQPLAKINHTICTGYAGFIGSMMKQRFETPLLLTEHGIYTKERISEINQAGWIYTPDMLYFDFRSDWRKLQELWIQLFMLLGKSTYHSCSRILTLYEGNARLQVEFGADPEIQEVLPNGIDPREYEEVRLHRATLSPSRPLVIGFIGRIVPIKDVETLLYASHAVFQKSPRTELRLYGPAEEDEEYYEKCLKLIRILGIGDRVRFMGSLPVKEILKEIDILVLTSISEGLPLVIFEAFASAIPCVSSDVGGCRDLLYGRTSSDKALGRGGILTGISSPDETSEALLTLLKNQELRLKMGQAGLQRVTDYYQIERVYQRYRELYRGLLDQTEKN